MYTSFCWLKNTFISTVLQWLKKIAEAFSPKRTESRQKLPFLSLKRRHYCIRCRRTRGVSPLARRFNWSFHVHSSVLSSKCRLFPHKLSIWPLHVLWELVECAMIWVWCQHSDECNLLHWIAVDTSCHQWTCVFTFFGFIRNQPVSRSVSLL